MTDTRTEILVTARTIILKEGHDALTAARITVRMDITDTGVYYGFETADDLAVGAVDHLESAALSRLADHEGPPDQCLASVVREQFAAAEELRDFTAPPSLQLVAAASGGNDELRETLVSLENRYVDAVADVIREGNEEGVRDRRLARGGAGRRP